ncbi:hypothetical protein GCM10028802_03210 [Terrabacter terrigena]
MGIELKNRLAAVRVRSTTDRGRTADTTPSRSQMIAPPTTTDSVIGRAEPMIVVTGTLWW